MPTKSPDPALEKANKRFLTEWRRQRLKDGKGGSALDHKAFWTEARDAIRAYLASLISKKDETTGTHLPAHLLRELDQLISELLAGRIPDKVLPLLTPGAPKLRPVEESARIFAAAYVREVRDGRINDPHPVKTIRKMFKIASRTASYWVNHTTDVPPLLLPSGVFSPENQTKLIQFGLKSVADEYLRHGRSQVGRVENRRQKRNRPKRGGTETP